MEYFLSTVRKYKKLYDEFGTAAVSCFGKLPLSMIGSDLENDVYDIIKVMVNGYFDTCYVRIDYRLKNWLTCERDGVVKMVFRDKSIYMLNRIYDNLEKYSKSKRYYARAMDLFNELKEFTIMVYDYAISANRFGEGFVFTDHYSKDGHIDGLVYYFHGNFYGDLHYNFAINLYMFITTIKSRVEQFESSYKDRVETLGLRKEAV